MPVLTVDDPPATTTASDGVIAARVTKRRSAVLEPFLSGAKTIDPIDVRFTPPGGGSRVTVTTDSYPDKTYRGRISFIASQAEFTPKTVETHAERITLVYRLKIDLENPTHELVPGLPADAHIALGPSGAS